MKLTNLEPAHDFEVNTWLENRLQLTEYQKDVLRRDEIVRFSQFYFYKRRKIVKSSVLIRLTIVFVPIYYVILLCYSFMFVTIYLAYNRKERI